MQAFLEKLNIYRKVRSAEKLPPWRKSSARHLNYKNKHGNALRVTCARGGAMLDNFAAHTEMSWWVFAASGLGMVFMAFVTLSIQTIRVARANPLNSLRTE